MDSYLCNIKELNETQQAVLYLSDVTNTLSLVLKDLNCL